MSTSVQINRLKARSLGPSRAYGDERAWEDLVSIEPQLALLWGRALKFRELPKENTFCANAIWYGYDELRGCGLKDAVAELAGWHAKEPRLRTSAAYNLVCQKVYEALPDCRNCYCC